MTDPTTTAEASGAGDVVRLRTAVPADVDDLVELIESAYRGEGSRQGWTTEADLLAGRRTGKDEIGPAIADPQGGMLVAERDGRSVGCCRVNRQADGTALFSTFAVRPDLQRAGLGDLLLGGAEAWAVQRWGAAIMEMTVISQRPELIDYYRRRGYQPTGQQKPFPYGDTRFGEPLRLDLTFVVLAKPLDGSGADPGRPQPE